MNTQELTKVSQNDKYNKKYHANVTNLNAYREEISQEQENKQISPNYVRELENIKFALDRAAIVAIADVKGIIIEVNQKFCQVSGYSQEELIGQSYQLINSGYHSSEFFSQLWSTISAGKVWHGEIKERAKNGSYYWVDTTIIPFLDENQQLYQYLAIQFEISDRKQIEEELRESRNQYQTLVNLSPVGLFRTDSEGKFLDVNERWCELSGMIPEEATGEGWVKSVHPEDRASVVEEWYAAIEKKLPFKSTEYRLQRPDGIVTWVYAQVVAETTTEGKILSYIGTIADITERRKAEEKLRYHAWHDSLTGLANRAYFSQHLEAALEREPTSSEFFAVFFLDLNRFKVVNDSLGHLVGDRLLCEVADRLRSCLRAEDLVARLGGDEFTILVENVHDIHQVRQIGDRLEAQLAQPFVLDRQQIFTSASIGIVLCYPKKAQRSSQTTTENTRFPHCPLSNLIAFHQNPEDILRAADTAMYRAKEQGGISRSVIFNPQMYEQAIALLELENDLRRALENCQEFVLHYQPIFSSETGKILSFEALVRWQHPQRGLVLPQEFIPLAEETGLIIPLGHYILAQAANQLQKWQSAFIGELQLTMNVNISPKQFADLQLVEQIKRILQATGIKGSSLNLEITESCLIDNPESATIMLLELKKLGIRLSIDDFGTGYSSLSHLVSFPIDNLKIDRSFISEIQAKQPKKERDSVVWTIITLAHNLGLEVVAEGVENEIQLEQLRELRCEKVQGNLFAQALAVEAATALLTSSAQLTNTEDKIIQQQKNNCSRQQEKLLKLARQEKLLKRRVATQIRDSLDLNKIIETAINEIRQMLDVECCQFLWYRPEAKMPTFEPIRQVCQLNKVCTGCVKPKTPAIDVLGEMLLSKNLLKIDNISVDPGIGLENRNYLHKKEIKSLLAIAIRPKSGEVGAIVCEHRQRRHIWQEEEIELLTDLADQLAIAIDLARLYEASRLAATTAKASAVQMQQALEKLQQTQSQLIQTEKMSSLGLLVAGVAHEVNNPINFISGNISHVQQYVADLLELLQLYQLYYPQPPIQIQELSEAIDIEFVQQDLPSAIASMKMGTSRIQEIVQSLRNFSRVDEAEMKFVNIHEGIDSTLLILSNRLKVNSNVYQTQYKTSFHSTVEIIKEYGNLPLVECYPGQLNQVFMNIICNALDALDSYNQQRFLAEGISSTTQILIRTEQLDANSIRVCIQDNGPGMTQEVKKRLFDPFFTTKPVGKGTGLGLSIGYQIIVEKHKGKLECFSSPGKGAEFHIDIPVRQTKLKPKRKSAIALSTAG